MSELTSMQKAIVRGALELYIDTIKDFPDKDTQLTIFKMINDNLSGTPSLVEEKNIRKWLDDAQIEDALSTFKMAASTPKELNLIRSNTYNDPDNQKHFPDVTQDDVNNHVKSVLNEEITNLEKEGAKPLELIPVTTIEQLDLLRAKAQEKLKPRESEFLDESFFFKNLAVAFVAIGIVKITFGQAYTKYKAKEREQDRLWHQAMSEGDKNMVASLISKGSKLNIQDEEGSTPLHRAALRRGYYEIADLLISKGAKLNIQDRAGFTPLHHAVWRGYYEIADLLISKGAKLIQDREGVTPLHVAAYGGSYEVANLLISKGVDGVNVQDREGFTPLHFAVWRGHYEIADLLISKGADLYVKDKNGRTPLSFAIELSHNDPKNLIYKQIVELLTTAEKNSASKAQVLDEVSRSVDKLEAPRALALDSQKTLIGAPSKPFVANVGASKPLITDSKSSINLPYLTKHNNYETPSFNTAIASFALLSTIVAGIKGNKLFDFRNNHEAMSTTEELDSTAITADNFHEKYSKFILEQPNYYQDNNKQFMDRYETKIVELLKHKATTEEVASWTKEEWMKYISNTEEFKKFIEHAKKEAKAREETSKPLTEKDIIAYNKDNSKKAKGRSL